MRWAKHVVLPMRDVLRLSAAALLLSGMLPTLSGIGLPRVAGFAFTARADEGQDRALCPARSPSGPVLTDEMKSRLLGAAADPNLAPWQSEFMRQLVDNHAPGISGPTNPAWSPGTAGPNDSGPDGVWSQLPPPTARSGHAAIYDPLRNRMLVFGGSDASRRRNDTWALSLSGTPAWTELAPTGTAPSPREDHTAVYDPVRDRMLVFGGYDGTLRNDTWELSLSGTPDWTQLVPAGPTPAVRSAHSAIYDPVGDQMVIFGGYGASGPPPGCLNDTWRLSLAGVPAWTQMIPAGPAPSVREGHTAIHDPVRDRMLVFGGLGSSYSNDTWELLLSEPPEWHELLPGGNPPSGRYEHAAIYDQVGDRMVIFGGNDGFDHNDSWVLSMAGGPTWSQLSPIGTPPSVRSAHTATYDSVGDRMLVFGGDGNDTWSLSLDGIPAWSEIVPAMSPPSARQVHTGIYDPVRDRMVIFGGFRGSPLNDTWALALAGTPAWSQINPTGTLPPARYGHAAVYDPIRDRMVIFAGFGTTYLNDTWVLSLPGTPAWSQLAPTGPPPAPRYRSAAIYDPLRDRMVVFGGYAGSSHSDETWGLSLVGTPAWSELIPAGVRPPGRSGLAAVYDPPRDRMVIFGGYSGSYPSYVRYNDSWEFSLGDILAWGELTPSGGPPSARSGHSAIYDPLRNRMVVFGGYDESYRNDTWELSLGDIAAWTELAPAGTPPFARHQHAAVYDPGRDQMLVFGGDSGNRCRDTWLLSWSDPSSVADPEEPPVYGDPGWENLRPFSLLQQNVPNPFHARTAIRYEVSSPGGPVSLSVYDVSGRLIRKLVDAQAEPGPHEVSWDGRDEWGTKVCSGVYFCRLVTGGIAFTRRMVLK